MSTTTTDTAIANLRAAGARIHTPAADETPGLRAVRLAAAAAAMVAADVVAEVGAVPDGFAARAERAAASAARKPGSGRGLLAALGRVEGILIPETRDRVAKARDSIYFVAVIRRNEIEADRARAAAADAAFDDIRRAKARARADVAAQRLAEIAATWRKLEGIPGFVRAREELAAEAAREREIIAAWRRSAGK